jgi:hypothetical protein
MNNSLKIVLISLGVITVILIGSFAYLGVFSSLKVTERTVGPYTYAYRSFIGDYKSTGPAFEEVYNKLKSKNITMGPGIGAYYDNPAKVPSAKLRSDCGFVIADKDIEKAKENGFKIGVFNRTDCLVVEFPIRNPLSYFVGPIKAYPALASYVKAKKYKEMDIGYEFYDEKNKKTLYVMKIIK